jgi:hypothetical protein
VNSEFIAGGNDAVLSVSPMNNGLRAIYTISDRLQFGEVRRNSAKFDDYRNKANRRGNNILGSSKTLRGASCLDWLLFLRLWGAEERRSFAAPHGS